MRSVSLNGFFLIYAASSLHAQVTNVNLERYLHKENKLPGIADAVQFYQQLNYSPVWIASPGRCTGLLTLLRQAGYLGLEPADYAIADIEAYDNRSLLLKNAGDSLAFEVKTTSTMLLFCRHLAYGNMEPDLAYRGIKHSPRGNLIPLVARYVVNNNIDSLRQLISPPWPEIEILEGKIRQMRLVMQEKNFREVVIKSAEVSTSNKPLGDKLVQLGIIGSKSHQWTNDTLQAGVIEAQRQFVLLSDGVLRLTAREQLNIPLGYRLRQLCLSVNYYRWLYHFLGSEPTIVVNIPAAWLQVYYQKKVILEMRMVLGKKNMPTPTFSSRIRQVVIYPYWHVPDRIATRELLPLFKRDAALVTAGNFQVLDKNGQILNPYKINWQNYSAGNFPFTLRQSTGCENALGLLKLDFYSPFGVYLHDTPYKAAFSLNKRYFSHGCMRMEKPFELARLVLRDHPLLIDTLSEKGCLLNPSPVYVPADAALPLLVWYNPAGVDSTGRVRYYEDVYNRFRWSKS